MCMRISFTKTTQAARYITMMECSINPYVLINLRLTSIVHTLPGAYLLNDWLLKLHIIPFIIKYEYLQQLHCIAKTNRNILKN